MNTTRIRQVENAAYLAALDFVIERRKNPELLWPVNPYGIFQDEECLAWRKEFDATVERHFKTFIGENQYNFSISRLVNLSTYGLFDIDSTILYNRKKIHRKFRIILL